MKSCVGIAVDTTYIMLDPSIVFRPIAVAGIVVTSPIALVVVESRRTITTAIKAANAVAIAITIATLCVAICGGATAASRTHVGSIEIARWSRPITAWRCVAERPP